MTPTTYEPVCPTSPAPSADVADPDRLKALESYGVLDTPAEGAFDDVVAMAAAVCETPISLVSLVAAERQWFKARVGMDATETPIEQSVCAHALAEDDLLVIPDLTLDPRTNANTLVTGDARLRFYAGAVLKTPDGHALGSLCVIDRKPRPGGLTAKQQDVLRRLGRQVSSMLEMRRKLVTSVDDRIEQARTQRQRDIAAMAVREQELKLRLAVEATSMGIFDYNLVTGELNWDARVRELFGIPRHAPVTYETAFLAGVHPDDREAADQAVQAALDPAGPGLFDTEYRTVAPDGEVRWLAARGQSVVENGEVVRFVGAVRDVTARKTVDEKIAATLDRYRLIGQVTKDVIWDWDLVSHRVEWNEAMTTVYGYRLHEIEPTPRWWLEHVHRDDRERVREDVARVINGTDRDWSHEYRFLRSDGTWAEVFDRGGMIRDADGKPLRMIGAMFDNSERKAEEARQKLLAHELDHRMKNLLTMVQAIAIQTLRAAPSKEEAQEMLSGRLSALSKAQGVLLRGEADGARLASVIDDALRSHLDAPKRISRNGPDLEIGPRAALPIVLMLHELATNAVKYGALSTERGAIEIDWTVSGRPGSEIFRLVWTERDGPHVAPPTRQGFGTRLIERGLAGQLGATVKLDYRPEGLRCILEAPLERLREAA